MSIDDHMIDMEKRTSMMQMMVKQQSADHQRHREYSLGECGLNPSGTAGVARNPHNLPAQFERQRQCQRSQFG